MRDAAFCREKAARFRELAKESDDRTAADLIQLAQDYEAAAQRLEPDADPPMLTGA